MPKLNYRIASYFIIALKWQFLIAFYFFHRLQYICVAFFFKKLDFILWLTSNIQLNFTWFLLFFFIISFKLVLHVTFITLAHFYCFAKNNQLPKIERRSQKINDTVAVIYTQLLCIRWKKDVIEMTDFKMNKCHQSWTLATNSFNVFFSFLCFTIEFNERKFDKSGQIKILFHNSQIFFFFCE